MKKILVLVLLTFMWCLMSAETIKTIGTTHYGSQELPFGMYYGYERSASFFASTEIGTFCFITKLAWEVQAGNPESCPVKIYLKQTSSSTLAATTWDLLISDATLVFNGVISFPASGWQIIDISDFGFTAGNLLVMCETDYGPVPPLTYPWFWYSLTSTNRHEFWRNNDPGLLGTGTLNKFRPNIQIHYLASSSHNPPSGFLANASGSYQVNLSWTRNSSNDNVLIAYNTVNTFGTPSGTYVAGNTISGGGNVIYTGSGTSFSQTTGLLPGTTYYYRAWSFYSTPPTYSSGASTSATTACLAQSVFPYLSDHESAQFPPGCWSLASKPWVRSADASGFGNGTASARADFFSIAVGNFDLVSPLLDMTTLAEPRVRFDFAYATSNGALDRLELWCSTDSGATYVLQQSWLGGLTGPLNTGGETTGSFVPDAGEWDSATVALPPGVEKVMFRGVSAYGNNLYLDNIRFFEYSAFVTWNGSVSDAWNNPLNWTPNSVPGASHTVIIPSGTSFTPYLNTGTINLKTITVQSGGALTVGSTTLLTIAQDLVIISGGTLSNSGTITLGGNLKYLTQQ